jgi:hypothetical protein
MDHWSDSEQIIKREARAKAGRHCGLGRNGRGYRGLGSYTAAIRAVWEGAHSWDAGSTTDVLAKRADAGSKDGAELKR